MTRKVFVDEEEGTIDATPAVAEFIKVFDASRDWRTWHTLVVEEDHELMNALGDYYAQKLPEHKAEVLKETADLIYVIAGFLLTFPSIECVRAVEGESSTKSLGASFEAAQANLVAGAKLFYPNTLCEAVARVHQSNLTKLVDGKPLRREDGKILKGPNYTPPHLLDLVTDL